MKPENLMIVVVCGGLLLIAIGFTIQANGKVKNAWDDVEETTTGVGDPGPWLEENAKKPSRWDAITGVDKQAAGMVEITATFDGTPPTQIAYDMSAAEKYCRAGEYKGKEDPDDTRRVNADKSVPWVFVQVADPPKAAKIGKVERAAVISQKGCVYRPHVLGKLTNQVLAFTTHDPTEHNVKASPATNPGFNKSHPTTLPVMTIDSLAQPEADIPVACEIHGWMTGRVFVMSHPYFATTNEAKGVALIQMLPAGKYKLNFWHETFKVPGDLSVTVEAGKTTKVTIKIKQ